MPSRFVPRSRSKLPSGKRPRALPVKLGTYLASKGRLFQRKPVANPETVRTRISRMADNPLENPLANSVLEIAVRHLKTQRDIQDFIIEESAFMQRSYQRVLNRIKDPAFYATAEYKRLIQRKTKHWKSSFDAMSANVNAALQRKQITQLQANVWRRTLEQIYRAGPK